VSIVIKSNITQQVSDYLKENLETGFWKIGEKIPSEHQLTKTLGVSRASIRMAIQQLIGIGALESAHGKGTFVINNSISALTMNMPQISEEDCHNIKKVLEFREIIETGTCFLAAHNATDENIHNLTKYLEEMGANLGKSKEFVKADMLFHEEIAKASGNSLLEKSLAEVLIQKMLNHQQINEIFGYDDGLHYHRLILAAIIEKDAQKAKDYMAQHLQKAIREMNI